MGAPATLLLEADGQGIAPKHGDSPNECDTLGAREALIFEQDGVYHRIYDGAGHKAKGGLLAPRPSLQNGLPPFVQRNRTSKIHDIHPFLLDEYLNSRKKCIKYESIH